MGAKEDEKLGMSLRDFIGYIIANGSFPPGFEEPDPVSDFDPEKLQIKVDPGPDGNYSVTAYYQDGQIGLIEVDLKKWGFDMGIIGVHPSFWRQGLVGRMYEVVEGELVAAAQKRDMDVADVWVETRNPNLRDAFKRRGYAWQGNDSGYTVLRKELQIAADSIDECVEPSYDGPSSLSD